MRLNTETVTELDLLKNIVRGEPLTLQCRSCSNVGKYTVVGKPKGDVVTIVEAKAALEKADCPICLYWDEVTERIRQERAHEWPWLR